MPQKVRKNIGPIRKYSKKRRAYGRGYSCCFSNSNTDPASWNQPDSVPVQSGPWCSALASSDNLEMSANSIDTCPTVTTETVDLPDNLGFDGASECDGIQDEACEWQTITQVVTSVPEICPCASSRSTTTDTATADLTKLPCSASSTLEPETIPLPLIKTEAVDLTEEQQTFSGSETVNSLPVPKSPSVKPAATCVCIPPPVKSCRKAVSGVSDPHREAANVRVTGLYTNMSGKSDSSLLNSSACVCVCARNPQTTVNGTSHGLTGGEKGCCHRDSRTCTGQPRTSLPQGDQFNARTIKITHVTPDKVGDCCKHCAAASHVLTRIQSELASTRQELGATKVELVATRGEVVALHSRLAVMEHLLLTELRAIRAGIDGEEPAGDTPASSSQFPVPFVMPDPSLLTTHALPPIELPSSVGVGVGKSALKVGSFKDECEFSDDKCVIPDNVVAMAAETADGNMQVLASTLTMALFGAEELHGRAVDGSKHGKAPLSPRRLAAIRQKVFDVHSVPCAQKREKWSRCKNAINAKLRNTFKK